MDLSLNLLFFLLEPVLAVHICSPKVTEHSQNDGSCHINCCVKNAPELTLTWYKGQEEINQISNPDISTNLSLPLEIQDEGMYRCVAANPVINETIFVNSTQWCPAHAGTACSVPWGIFCVCSNERCYEKCLTLQFHSAPWSISMSFRSLP